MTPDPDWLNTALPLHPIWTLPPTASSGDEQRSTMVVRGADLIVSVGKELRMCSLVDVKAGGRAGYKTLRAPNLNFEISHLVPSPSGKLLAVLGSHQVAVVVLPRSGYINLVTPTIDCRSIIIGSYYHHTLRCSPLSKALWHPLSATLSSLLVLTLDGQLREYDPLQNAEEPRQTVSLLPPLPIHKSANRSGYWAADEPGSRQAVSFQVGKGDGDWGSLSVYGLMGNGDVYGICPFLPSVARLPRSYISSLSTITAQKLSFLHSPSLSSSTSSLTTAPPSPHLLARYEAQQEWLDQLVEQIPPLSEEEDAEEEVVVKLDVSSGSPRPVAAQGPFLFDPAPREFDGGDHGLSERATDLVLVSMAPKDREETDESDDLGVLAIVWKDGRVDVCLEVEKLEGVWTEDELDALQSNPTVSVYETIELFPDPSSLSPALLTALEQSSPTFMVDPLYDDTLYVRHALGVHCIVMRKWMDALGAAIRVKDEGKRQGVVESVLGKGIGSVVGCVVDSISESGRTSTPVQSVAIINDVYLSYAVLAITSSLQVVALELNLRANAPPSPTLSIKTLHDPSPALSSTPADSSSFKHYISYLTSEPFTIPTVLSDASPKGRVALPPPPAGHTNKLQTITPDNLRYLGKTIEGFRSSIRDVVSAGSSVHGRVALQLKELERQNDKVGEIEQQVKTLRFGSDGESRLESRVERVKKTQKELIARTDRTLQRLIDRQQPMLSDLEKAWFEELAWLTDEVTGTRAGLADRVALIEHRLNVLRPRLEEMHARAVQVKEAKKKQNAALGQDQLAKLEQELALESKLIATVTSKLDQLSVRTNAAALKT